jgi:hypothetical protein
MIINDKLLQEKIEWTPHLNQQKILDGSKGKRNISICAGVRFGKSALCGYIAFKHLLCDNQRIWIVSLSYDMAQKVFSYITEFAGRYDKRLLRGASNRPPQRFEIPEFNSFVECKSIENVNSLLGEELDLCIFDEASRFGPDIYDRYIAARLSSRKGRLFSISTPFGKNWFYRNHLKADASFNFSSKDNPYFPLEEWERAKKILPEMIFKQEYEAKFLEDAASVFRKIDDCLADCLEDVKSGHSYILGVDIGKVEDFTVITVIDRETNSVVYWDRFNKIDYPFQKARILSVSERYNHARIIIDSTAVGSPIKDDLERAGAYIDDFKFSNKSKKELVEKLSIFIEQRGVKIPNNPILIEELESFGYRLTESGNVIYSAPEGQHDDCVYSLGLAVWGLTPFSKPVVNYLKERLKNVPQDTSFI